MKEMNVGKKTMGVLRVLGVLAALAVLFCSCSILDKNAKPYKEAVQLMEDGKYSAAKAAFVELGDYKDASDKAKECGDYISYESAQGQLKKGEFEKAAEAFEKLGEFADSVKKAEESYWRIAEAAGDLAALARFCDKYPDGEYADELAAAVDAYLSKADVSELWGYLKDVGQAHEAAGEDTPFLDEVVERLEETLGDIKDPLDLAMLFNDNLSRNNLIDVLEKALNDAMPTEELGEHLYSIGAEKFGIGEYAISDIVMERLEERSEVAKEEMRIAREAARLAKENSDWEEALKSDTVKAYEEFAQEWPDSPHATDAVVYAESLRQNPAVAEAILANAMTVTESEINQFLADYPGHVATEEVKAILTMGQGSLSELLDRGLVTVSVVGSSISTTKLTVTNNYGRTVKGTMPFGSYFAANSSSVQNMVLREEVSVNLAPGESKTYSVATACMNISRSIPGSSNSFKLADKGADSVLGKLMKILSDNNASYDVAQAAVWIVTDNPSDSKLLNTLVYSDGTKVISSDELAKAKEYVAQAKK
ncbi:MAG: hypothetical protein LBR77_03055 [Lachnospiraceae bacterium]|jgi:outer membrane protein assembly factor BamD (BamD/ComL family)|nr:hypothetical protein [Lachnospiraceae bacterium]